MIRNITAAVLAALLLALLPQPARAACDYDVGGVSPFLMTTFEAQLDEELGCIGTKIDDVEISSIRGLTSAANKIPYYTGAGTAALADFSAAIRTIITTPSSANLAAWLSDETGTGVAVFATSPTLVTPVLGVATATTINGATITSGTLNGSVTGTNTGDQTITLTGDVTGSGTGSFAATVAADSVALTTDTTGNYQSGNTAGTGIAVTQTPAEGFSPTVAFDFTDAGADPALGAAECRFSNEGASPAGIVCEGDTADTFETRIRLTDPTADRLMTIPNADSAAVQPLTCGGTDKVSAISAAGVVTCTADAGGAGSGDNGTVNATALTDFNLNDTLPAAVSGANVLWQMDAAATPDNVSAYVPASSATVIGAVELATTTEQLTGTDAARSATPDSIAALWEAGSDIADGATITIGEGGYFNLITSTVAITSFSITTDKAGRSFRVRFNTARTLTHNATSLILPGAANIPTAVGDIAFVRSLGGGNVVVENYTKANGTALVSSGGITQATEQATTSGTAIDFTGIPATAKRITIMLDGVSTSGTSDLLVQLGDSGGIENTGYAASATNSTTNLGSTAGFPFVNATGVARLYSGALVLTLMDTSNTWAFSGITRSDNNPVHYAAGIKATSVTLDRVRLTTAGGTDTFDAGAMNISYE